MVKQTTIKMDLLSAQHSIWERLVRITKSENIGNAYLFSGSPGSGKEGLAIKFAQFLNCNNADEQACDICSSCIRFKKLQHEKLKIIVPLPTPKKNTNDSVSKTDLVIDEYVKSISKKAQDLFYKIQIPKANRILIQSIRELRRSLLLKHDSVGKNIVLFFDAHLLSSGQAEAANALLKILEEPPENTTLVLVTDHKELMLKTILSRCQHIQIPRLPDDFILEWLINNDLGADTADFIAGLSRGNIHQARNLSSRPVEDTIGLIRSLVQTVVSQSPDKWRTFTQTYGKLAGHDPAEFKFHFSLMTLWFRGAYRLRKGVNTGLKDTSIESDMVSFNESFPHADLMAISLGLEDSINAILKNLYKPLILTNLLLDIQGYLRE